MSRTSAFRIWGPSVARVAVVGAASAGLVVGAGRVASDAGQPDTAAAPRVAAPMSTAYCAGDPFVDADEGAPRADLDARITAQAAPSEVLEGLVAPSDDPGEITLGGLDPAPSSPTEAKPRSGPMTEQVDRLTGDPVRVHATGDHAPGLLAGQGFVASGKRVAGLAETPCLTPTADAWLVAGGGERGRQERLVLVNPGGNAVTARVDPVGAPDGQEGHSVVVPAHGRAVVLLDAVGGTRAPQAVHVTTTGGLVVPTVVDHHLDGLTPAGVEMVTPTAAPARRQVLPTSTAGEDHGVVLANPGTADAVVQIRRLGDGPSRGVKVATVPAGAVADVDLKAVDGTVAWAVESDEPVVAAAHLTTTDGKGRSDMAWSVATAPFAGLGGAVLPGPAEAGLRRDLEIVATGGPATVDVLVLEGEGIEQRSLDLAEDRGTTVDLGDAEAVWVRPTQGRVQAAVLVLGAQGAASARATSVPVLPTRVAVRDVPVTRVQ